MNAGKQSPDPTADFLAALVDEHRDELAADLRRLVELGVLDLYALRLVAGIIGVVFSSEGHQALPVLQPRGRLDDSRSFDAAVIDAGLLDFVRPITAEERLIRFPESSCTVGAARTPGGVGQPPRLAGHKLAGKRITCPTKVPGPLYVHLTQVKPGLVRRAPMGLTFLGDAPPDVSSPSGPEPASQEPHGGPDATRQG